jgi:hypothetical protein
MTSMGAWASCSTPTRTPSSSPGNSRRTSSLSAASCGCCSSTTIICSTESASKPDSIPARPTISPTWRTGSRRWASPTTTYRYRLDRGRGRRPALHEGELEGTDPARSAAYGPRPQDHHQGGRPVPGTRRVLLYFKPREYEAFAGAIVKHGGAASGPCLTNKEQALLNLIQKSVST